MTQIWSWNFFTGHEITIWSWNVFFVRHEIFWSVMNSNSGHENFHRHEFKFWSWNFFPSWIQILVMKIFTVMNHHFMTSWNSLPASWILFHTSWINTSCFGHEIFHHHESHSGHEIIHRHDSLPHVMKSIPCVMKCISYVMHHHILFRCDMSPCLECCGGGHLYLLISTIVCTTPQDSDITPTFAVCHIFYWLFFMHGTPSCTQHRYTRERNSNRWWHTPTHSTILNPLWRPDISAFTRRGKQSEIVQY